MPTKSSLHPRKKGKKASSLTQLRCVLHFFRRFFHPHTHTHCHPRERILDSFLEAHKEWKIPCYVAPCHPEEKRGKIVEKHGAVENEWWVVMSIFLLLFSLITAPTPSRRAEVRYEIRSSAKSPFQKIEFVSFAKFAVWIIRGFSRCTTESFAINMLKLVRT